MHRDIISIDGLEIDCVVGVHHHERDKPQRLRVDVAMVLDTEAAGASERISRTVDYHQSAAQVVFLLQSCRFRLVETAAHALAGLLLLPPLDDRRPRTARVELRLAKPNALDGVAVPSLRVERDVSWAVHRKRDAAFGSIDVVHETPDVGIYRLNLRPKGRLALHHHGEGTEATLVLDEGLLCQGKPEDPGAIHRWEAGAAHSYENPTDRVQSLLCVHSPPVSQHVGMAAAGEPALLKVEPAWPGLVQDR